MAKIRPSSLPFVAVSIALAGCGAQVPGQPSSAAPRPQAPAAAQAAPKAATADQVQAALAFKANLASFDQLKTSTAGPVDEDKAPPAELLAKVLPVGLTPEQAQKLLISVPSAMVATKPSDRHTDFLGPFWGAPYLDPLFGLGIGPLSFFPFDYFAMSEFFPFFYGGSTFFFPYAFAGGLFYPSFCPFYWGASAFLPYCQPPLTYYGTGGMPPFGPPIAPPLLPPVPAGLPPIGPGLPPIGPGLPPVGPGLPPGPVPAAGCGVPCGPGAGPLPPVGAGMPFGAVPPVPPMPLAAPPMPLTPLPVTVAEGARPLLYFPGEVPIL